MEHRGTMHILERLAQQLLDTETVEGEPLPFEGGEEIVQGLDPVYPVPHTA